jgi:hypothetical protein
LKFAIGKGWQPDRQRTMYQRCSWKTLLYTVGRILVPFWSCLWEHILREYLQCKILWGYALLCRKFWLSYTGFSAGIFPRTYEKVKKKKSPWLLGIQPPPPGPPDSATVVPFVKV